MIRALLIGLAVTAAIVYIDLSCPVSLPEAENEVIRRARASAEQRERSKKNAENRNADKEKRERVRKLARKAR